MTALDAIRRFNRNVRLFPRLAAWIVVVYFVIVAVTIALAHLCGLPWAKATIWTAVAVAATESIGFFGFLYVANYQPVLFQRCEAAADALVNSHSYIPAEEEYPLEDDYYDEENEYGENVVTDEDEELEGQE